jgi:hypothetical protein
VFVLGALRALRLRRLVRVRVFAAAVSGSVFVDGATHCALHLAARQVRIHHSTDTDFYLVRSLYAREGRACERGAPGRDVGDFAGNRCRESMRARARAARCPLTHASLLQRVRSRPIIEDTTRARFAPYAFAFDGGAALLTAAGLSLDAQNEASAAATDADACADAWCQVDDFAWLRATPSPNWRVLPAEERAAPPCAPGDEGAHAGADAGASADADSDEM